MSGIYRSLNFQFFKECALDALENDRMVPIEREKEKIKKRPFRNTKLSFIKKGKSFYALTNSTRCIVQLNR